MATALLTTSPVSVHEGPNDPTPSNTSPGSVATPSTGLSKRPSGTSPDAENRRKVSKVSRACDHCKLKKLKCGGTLPCDVCVRRGFECRFQTEYRRGRPPTPPAGLTNLDSGSGESGVGSGAGITLSTEQSFSVPSLPRGSTEDVSPGRPRLSYIKHVSTNSHASSEPKTDEIEGQFSDPTSSFSFLRRTWKRFSVANNPNGSPMATASDRSQPLVSSGDKPLVVLLEQPLILPDRRTAQGLFDYFFDQCMVTYRCLNQQYCTVWLNALLDNVDARLPLHHVIGHGKAAVVMVIFALGTFHQERVTGDDSSLRNSDSYFHTSANLTTEETGQPRLESVQARVFQVLYLLQTRRLNQAWYIFGSIIPISSALGLHRRSVRGGGRGPTTGDFIIDQCQKRTFWVVYTFDIFLSMNMGRPRITHDEDIDQDYPDPINDEEMTPQGPLSSDPAMDSHLDSLIFLAKLAKIIGAINSEVYSLRRTSRAERLAAARTLNHNLHAWRDSLPPHLGTIRPQSLIPAFRRQALTLKIVYAHAIMHAYRPFLLGSGTDDESVAECIGAARMALETIDTMIKNTDRGLLGFWGMPYVTYYSLTIIYVWLIQQRANNGGRLVSEDPNLLDLTERCHAHLSRTTVDDSPSWRYSVILEEFRQEARREGGGAPQPLPAALLQSTEGLYMPVGMEMQGMFTAETPQDENLMDTLYEWQPVDWIELDSSAFGPLPDYESPLLWMSDMNQGMPPNTQNLSHV